MQKGTRYLQYHNTDNGQANSLSGLVVEGLSEREPFQPFDPGYRKGLLKTKISLYGQAVWSGSLLLHGPLNIMYF